MKKKTQQYCWGDNIDGSPQDITSNELTKLAQFLRKSCLPGGCTSLSMVDGFLTALVVGPEGVFRERHQGLQLVWGDNSERWLKKEMTKHEMKMRDLLYRRCNEIYFLVADESEEYQPLIESAWTEFLEDQPDPEVPSVIGWCRGFMKYFAIDPRAWAPVLRSEVGRNHIRPIIYFGTANGWTKKVEDKYDLASYRDLLADNLKYFVLGIKEAFRGTYGLDEMKGFLDSRSPHWEIPRQYSQGADYSD